MIKYLILILVLLVGCDDTPSYSPNVHYDAGIDAQVQSNDDYIIWFMMGS